MIKKKMLELEQLLKLEAQILEFERLPQIHDL